MKIISLNLAGRKGDIGERIGKIAKFLDTEQADVACLQEVTFGEGGNLAERINNLMGKNYKNVVADLAEEFIDKNGQPQSDGLAVLTNLGVVKHECLTLGRVSPDERGRPDFHKRIVQVMEFENEVKMANLHLASNGNSYLQLRETLGRVSSDCMLVGDFNMHKEKMFEEENYWGEKWRCSVEFCDYVSFPSEGATFDYLLLPKGKEFIGVRTVQGLSDHCVMVYEY